LIYNLKLDLFILTTLVYSAELLTDISYSPTNFAVSYTDALDGLRVHLNIILFKLNLCLFLNTLLGL